MIKISKYGTDLAPKVEAVFRSDTITDGVYIAKGAQDGFLLDFHILRLVVVNRGYYTVYTMEGRLINIYEPSDFVRWYTIINKLETPEKPRREGHGQTNR